MDEKTKEFEGKTTDDAVQAACSEFKCTAEDLEYEIVEGGSSGIFGLVGVKKARIRAKKIMTQDMEVVSQDIEGVSQNIEDEIRTVLQRLLAPFAPEAELDIDTQSTPIQVNIRDNENSGLIIGRDGQTITALQYMTNRIVSRRAPECGRIQLDAGDYRERQDENLVKTSQCLAQKAKTSHRVQSTRPLSSYHRRIVHLALQNEEGITTRSKGDGPLKRVLIMPRKWVRRPSNSGDRIQDDTALE